MSCSKGSINEEIQNLCSRASFCCKSLLRIGISQPESCQLVVCHGGAHFCTGPCCPLALFPLVVNKSALLPGLRPRSGVLDRLVRQRVLPPWASAGAFVAHSMWRIEYTVVTNCVLCAVFQAGITGGCYSCS